VMGTGNPGVSPERPRPVPLNTLTLGAGRGISRVRVRVLWGFKGIRVVLRVTLYLRKIRSYTKLITIYIILLVRASISMGGVNEGGR